MHLLTPITIGHLHLPNRVVMAPLTRSRAYGTLPQPIHAQYYAQRASAGLIVSEATQIMPRGQGYPDTPGIYSEAQVRAWAPVTEAVHRAGGRIVLQLWHVGRISHPVYHGGQPPVAPSPVKPEGQALTPGFIRQDYVTPQALTKDDIKDVVAHYQQATRNARAAGFDGVEIHGANGYLIEQFLRTGTNHRSDDYGGTLASRARFLREVTEAVIDAWDAGYVGLRLSPNNAPGTRQDADPIETYSYAARLLSDYELAYLHVVEAEVGSTQASKLMREHYQGNLMVTGGLTKERGESLLQSGTADLIGYGRLFISNPDLVERFAQDAPLSPWDTSTFYGGGEKGYLDYPTLDREAA
jgi:N-ethylmaleimide reductase